MDGYRIIESEDARALEEKVSTALNNNYVVHGPLQALAIPTPNGGATVRYIQAMVHVPPKANP